MGEARAENIEVAVTRTGQRGTSNFTVVIVMVVWWRNKVAGGYTEGQGSGLNRDKGKKRYLFEDVCAKIHENFRKCLHRLEVIFCKIMYCILFDTEVSKI